MFPSRPRSLRPNTRHINALPERFKRSAAVIAAVLLVVLLALLAAVLTLSARAAGNPSNRGSFTLTPKSGSFHDDWRFAGLD
jgi:hypothetical protein